MSRPAIPSIVELTSDSQVDEIVLPGSSASFIGPANKVRDLNAVGQVVPGQSCLPELVCPMRTLE